MGNSRATLIPHPDGAVRDARVTVAAWRAEDHLIVDFVLDHAADIHAPAPTSDPQRRDGLWQDTCYEAFVAAEGAVEYVELNAAPDGDWAAYAFASYRDRASCDPAAAHVATEPRADGMRIRFRLPDAWTRAPLRIGISAVLRHRDGATGWHALVHPPGRPDFHHSDCFVWRIAAPGLPC